MSYFHEPFEISFFQIPESQDTFYTINFFSDKHRDSLPLEFVLLDLAL